MARQRHLNETALCYRFSWDNDEPRLKTAIHTRRAIIPRYKTLYSVTRLDFENPAQSIQYTVRQAKHLRFSLDRERRKQET